jgi:hypothetical protein
MMLNLQLAAATGAQAQAVSHLYVMQTQSESSEVKQTLWLPCFWVVAAGGCWLSPPC